MRWLRRLFAEGLARLRASGAPPTEQPAVPQSPPPTAVPEAALPAAPAPARAPRERAAPRRDRTTSAGHDRRRELKRLGKRLVEESSARVREAVSEAYSFDVTLERERRERQLALEANRTEVLPAEHVGSQVVLLPASNLLEKTLDPFDFFPVPGWYLRCVPCGDLVPTCPTVPLGCRCGNVHLGPGGRTWAFGSPRAIEQVKVIAKARTRDS